jgi:hypothetical protein
VASLRQTVERRGAAGLGFAAQVFAAFGDQLPVVFVLLD